MSRHSTQAKSIRRQKRKEKRESRAVMRSVPGGPIFVISPDSMKRTVSYDITFGKLDVRPDPALDSLTDDERAAIYDQMKRGSPECIERLKQLIEQYPDAPTAHNWLYNALSTAGRDAEADQIIRRAFERFPDYLFAHLGLVQHLLYKRQIDEAEELMKGFLSVQDFHPDRKLFHITEHYGFEIAFLQLNAARKRFDVAESRLRQLRDLVGEESKLFRDARMLVDRYRPASFLARSIQSVLDMW